jgi:hypothetical protein
VNGISLEVNGVKVKTDNEGWANIELKNIKDRIFILKITDPKRITSIERKIAVPIVCASPGLVHYKTITVNLSEIH